MKTPTPSMQTRMVSDMDPDQALKDGRTLAERIIERGDSLDPSDTNSALVINEDAMALAERFQSLDSWMKAGNFPPKDWRENIDRLTRDVLKQFACNRHAYDWMNEIRERFKLPALTEADYEEGRIR